MKLTLPSVTSTNMLSTINNNFDELVAELQNNVFYRTNPPGEPNTVTNTLDMDGNDVINVSMLGTQDLTVGGVPIQDLIDGGASSAAEDAIAAAEAAAISAAAAAASVASVGTIIGTAEAARDAAIDAAADAEAAAATAASAGAAAGAAAAVAGDALIRSDLISSPEGVTTKGANMIHYRQVNGGVSVERTLQSKLEDVVSAADFGLSTSASGAANVTAMTNAIAFANAVGGCTIRVPRGTFNMSGSVLLHGNNLRITGEGERTTVFNQLLDSPTFSTAIGTFYQELDHFGITNAVTQTGHVLYFTGASRSHFHHLRITGHANGITMYGFEQTKLSEISITAPSNSGIALVCGHQAAPGTNTGANLLVEGLFIRGNDELVGGPIVSGTYGIAIYDAEAVWMFNTDISNTDQSSLIINPNWRAANHYFVQCFFDGSRNNHLVAMLGADKQNITFTGCWISSAGQASFGGVGASRFGKAGLYMANAGTYVDIQFTGCRFFANYGSGVFIETPSPDVIFSGCSMFSNGADVLSAPYRHGVFISPTSTQSQPAVITGCKMRGNGGFAIRSDGTARNNVVVGCQLEGGVSNDAAATYGAFTGNF